MKALLITLYLFTNIIFLNAQSTFFKWYPSEDYEYVYSSSETIDGSFLIVGLKRIPDYSGKAQAYILKIDYLGERIQENVTPLYDTADINEMIIKDPSSQDNFVIVGIKEYTCDSTELCQGIVLKTINANLQLIDSRRFDSPLGRFILPQAYTMNQNNIFSVLSSISTSNPYFHTIGWTVTNYSFTLDSLSSYTYSVSNYDRFPFGIISSDSNTIKCFDGMFERPTIATSLDDNLTFQNSDTLPSFITTACSTKYSDSCYLLTGTVANLAYIPEHIEIFKLNGNNDTIKSTYYYCQGDSVLYAGAVKNTEIIGNKIFVVGIYNISPSQYPWQNSPTWIQITRIDTSLQIIGQSYFGGDAVYLPFHILSTEDGGALIIGNRYDYHYPAVKKFHVFALKVNVDGIITQVPTDTISTIQKSSVSPNPGNDFINVFVKGNVTNTLFNMFEIGGKLVLENSLFPGNTCINTQGLPPGIYLYRIKSNNKIIESGRWYKSE